MAKRSGQLLGAVVLAVSASGCTSDDDRYVEFNQTASTEDRGSADQQPATETAVSEPDATEPQQSSNIPDESTAGSSPGATANAAPKSPQDSSSIAAPEAQAVAGAGGNAVTSQVSSTSVSANSVESAFSPREIVSPGEIVSPVSGLTGPADVPAIDNAAPAEPRQIQLLVPHKSFRRERGTDAVRVSYDDIDLLKILNMDPVPPNAREYFPDWLQALDGKPIRIRGFMYPEFVVSGITSFTLARDNAICCFQRMPKVYDVILVKLADGESTDYIDLRPFDVEGIFRIDSTPDDTELPRLYRIENARVLQ